MKRFYVDVLAVCSVTSLAFGLLCSLHAVAAEPSPAQPASQPAAPSEVAALPSPASSPSPTPSAEATDTAIPTGATPALGTTSTEVPVQSEFVDDLVATPVVRQKRMQLANLGGYLGDLLELHLPELSGDADPTVITPTVLRRLRGDISDILATEGYFSPLIRFRGRAQNSDDNVVLVDVTPGPRTLIKKVTLDFSGELQDNAMSAAEPLKQQAKEQRDELIANWRLPIGDPFRQSLWSSAKDRLLDNLRSDRYASASIVDSQAIMDAQTNSGELWMEINSGPAFTFGAMQVTGLQRYPAWLLERYQPPQPGEPYSRLRLLDYQRALQNSPYFSTVAVSVDPDPSQAAAAKVDVSVVERRSRDLGFGVGYSTNTGYRGEVSYRDRNILDKAWDLRSAVRLEQRRQVAYADVYLPPRVSGHLDSFGFLVDRQDVSGLKSTTTAVGVKRTTTRGKVEQRLGINLTGETTKLNGEAAEYKKALVASAGWTWRDIDDAFDPRDGQIYQLDFSGSSKVLISDQNFFRVAGKYQQWIPIGSSDSIVLRAEAGQVFANSEDGIPEDYLFRTGGSSTVRGYGYQSLGVQHPGGTTGGRAMAVASAEYVHWIKENWGVATFVDVGDAAATWRDFSGKQGLGIGGRYKTPAGPIALDLAYGRQTKRLRLEFSIAIAF